MPDDTQRGHRRDQAAASRDDGTVQSGTAWYGRFLSWRWLAVLLVASLVLHGMGLASYALLGGMRSTESTPEFALGDYRFLVPPCKPGRVEEATFSLHIALLEHVERPARERLRERQHRVRQKVEELLRRAHGGDFEDPSLAGLRRQLQEQINETLGMRAIADVVITNLDVKYRPASTEPADPQTAEMASWNESP